MHFPVLVLFASALLAQSSGKITGTLTDVYGGVLGKAAIHATNVATKALYKAESSPTGVHAGPVTGWNIRHVGVRARDGAVRAKKHRGPRGANRAHRY